ncbi:MAG: hypothetical protein AAF518_06580 [Spirochaetota bacterium]
MSNYAIAMLLGILGTTVYHLSKGMQKQGIESYGLVLSWLKREITSQEIGKQLDKPIIYVLGMLLNGSLPIILIVSGKFAPASYFTSMSGLGLIVLMVYSARILKEPVTKNVVIGSVVLILGTVFLGVENMYRPTLDMSKIYTNRVWTFVGVYMLVSLLFLALVLRRGSVFLIGISFGLFTGFAACLDPIYKAIGQNLGGRAGYFPSTIEGWLVFLASFLFGFVSLTMTQWGFALKARASVLIPIHNSVLVTLPICIQVIALPGYKVTYITLIGLVLTIAGILSMNTLLLRE